MISDKNILIELHCLPSIEYFKLITCNNATIEQFENYNKRSYRNKFTLLSPNGVKTISIPLQKGKNNGTPITEVKIAYEGKWVTELERAFISYYKNAPYFDHYFNPLMDIFKAKKEYLFQLNTELFNFINNQLNLKITLQYTNGYEKKPSTLLDLRNTIIPKQQSTEDLVSYDYGQVFEYKFGFTPRLSIIDLLFNLGSESFMIINDES